MSSTCLPVPCDSFDLYMAEINRFDLLSREEEYDLAVQYRLHGDLEAAHRLICSNLRFVVKIAQEYRAYGMRMLDMIQEGNVGLMRAVKKFDPDKGIRFISYAVWWVRAHIQEFIIRSWSLVKIGTTQAQKKLFFKLNQTRAKLLQLTGQEDCGEIADQLRVRQEDVEEMTLRMGGRDTSLDVEMTEGNDYTLIDLLPDDRQNQEERLLLQEEEEKVTGKVSRALRQLNERERKIIRDRILSDTPRTLQELANDYGISRERVRQLEKSAMDKMRCALLQAT